MRRAPAGKLRGALLGAVVGDGLGAPFEGYRGPVPAAAVERIKHDVRRLRYTDDTAMTFAVAESLLFRVDLDEDHFGGDVRGDLRARAAPRLQLEDRRPARSRRAGGS